MATRKKATPSAQAWDLLWASYVKALKKPQTAANLQIVERLKNQIDNFGQGFTPGTVTILHKNEERRAPESLPHSPPRAMKLVLSDVAMALSRHPRGAMATMGEVRKISKVKGRTFDAAILALAKDGKIIIHHHDLPFDQTEEARALMVQDQHGTFYHAVALR